MEQCRSDGGSDCMKYSATNTADGETNNTTTPNGAGQARRRPVAERFVRHAGVAVGRDRRRRGRYSRGRDNRPGGVSAA